MEAAGRLGVSLRIAGEEGEGANMVRALVVLAWKCLLKPMAVCSACMPLRRKMCASLLMLLSAQDCATKSN